MLEGELEAMQLMLSIIRSEQVIWFREYWKNNIYLLFFLYLQIKRLLTPLTLSSGFKNVKNINSCISSSSLDLNPQQTIKYSADPLSALSRDSFAVYQPSFDFNTTLALFNLKVYQLEDFIKNHKINQKVLQNAQKAADERYEKILGDLEVERIKNKTFESKYQDYDRGKLEEEIQTLKQTIEETKSREKQIIYHLLGERTNLILKLIEEKHQNEELRQVLSLEKAKISELVLGLEGESERNLQLESELEKYLNDSEKERSSFKAQLQESETKNAELQKEIDQLRGTIDGLKVHQPVGVSKSADSAVDKWNIGEGVRSSIVSMPVSTKVHSLSSVSAVAHPKASLAQAVTKTQSIPSTNTILPPPSIPVPQPKQVTQSQQNTATMKKLVPMSAPLSTDVDVDAAKPTDIGGSKTEHSVRVKQNILLFEAQNVVESSPAQIKPRATGESQKLQKPPLPANKPTIKPVLLLQAQSKIKDAKNVSPQPLPP